MFLWWIHSFRFYEFTFIWNFSVFCFLFQDLFLYYFNQIALRNRETIFLSCYSLLLDITIRILFCADRGDPVELLDRAAWVPYYLLTAKIIRPAAVDLSKARVEVCVAACLLIDNHRLSCNLIHAKKRTWWKSTCLFSKPLSSLARLLFLDNHEENDIVIYRFYRFYRSSLVQWIIENFSFLS